MLSRLASRPVAQVYARPSPSLLRRSLLPTVHAFLPVSRPTKLLSRGYAQQPPNGGQSGGFPGFPMFGQQRQKGEALKEYVSTVLFTEQRNSVIT